MKVRLMFFVLLALALSGLSAVQAAPSKPVIGISVPNTGEKYYALLVKAARTRAQAAGVDVVFVDAEDDLEKEVANVKSLVDQKVDAILYLPLDFTESAAALDPARKANIPVLLLDANFNIDPADKTITPLVKADNLQAGMLAAKTLCTKLSGKKATILDLAPFPETAQSGESLGTIQARARQAAVRNYVKKSCPLLTLKSMSLEGTDRDAMRNTLRDQLKAEPASAVVTYNGPSVSTLIEAATLARVPAPVVVSFDVTGNILSAIRSGRVLATVGVDPEILGRSAIDTTKIYIRNKSFSPVLIKPALLDAASIQGLDSRKCPGGCP